jgi:hypothetical protein
MKQLLDRIAASFIGIIVLTFIEGIITLGAAFRFEEYNWLGCFFQFMMIFLAIWAANKAYEAEVGK